VTYRIFITPIALKMLGAIADRRIREKIRDIIDRLAHEPEKQGKPLLGELAGYRSIRAVGQRYRIIYQIEGEKVVVLIVALGIRRKGSKADIYSLAKKLLRLKLIE
jgi:mRNA interferase RelE/StbE